MYVKGCQRCIGEDSIERAEVYAVVAYVEEFNRNNLLKELVVEGVAVKKELGRENINKEMLPVDMIVSPYLI